jgi:hypothetical protein
MVNRRAAPVMLRGVWDCVGLLFAASGLLLIVLPNLLRLLYRKSLGQVFIDESGVDELVTRIFDEFWGLMLLYYLLLVCGIVLLIWLRWNKTIVYNVDAERLGGVLHRALSRLGLQASRSANQVIVRHAPAREEPIVAELDAAANSARARPAPLVSSLPEAVLVIEPFAALGNVTISWLGARPGLRDEIENELAKSLEHARLDDNPAGTWFLGVAGALFSLIFVIVLVIVMATFLPPRGP